jgi:hypothetical protein
MCKKEYGPHNGNLMENKNTKNRLLRRERIIYNVLWLYRDEEKNKGLVIPLERAIVRVTKATGKSGQQKNINRNFANAQESRRKSFNAPQNYIG